MSRNTAAFLVGVILKMVDLEIEEFTAEEAARAGLIEAVKRGEVKITGTYEVTPEGVWNYDQNNFLFKDKGGNWRAGKFKDKGELLDFTLYF